MAAQVGALRVAIGADITGLKTGMARAQREVSRGATAMQRSIKSVNTSFQGLGTVAGVSLGAAGLLAGAQAFLRVADAAKSLQAQLKLATAEYGSLERANKDVRAIAEQTRSDLLATAELYAALQRNSGQLGTTQEQVARATQTVAQAFKISGAATSEQSAATRQLIQAFQSGVLRGDEFNSIMENAPRLAKLLADSLGVTTGELRKMAEAGELTADKLVRAFTDTQFTKGLDDEFKQLPVTFDEAMGQVYNAAIVVFSAFDRGGQFSNSIANFVSDGTEGFAQLEERAFRFGEQVSDTIAAIEAVRDALAGLKTDGIGSFFGLTDATYGWRDALADTLGVLDGVANAFANLANAPGNLIRLGLGQQPIVDPSNMRGRFLNQTRERRTEAARDRIMGRGVRDVLAEFGLSQTPPPFRAPTAKPKKGGSRKGRTARPPRDRSEDVSYQFEQELRQAQMDVLRAQQALAVTSEDRARIALQLLEAERGSQEAELNERVRRAERDFAEKKITAGALEQVKVQAEQLRLEYDKTTALEVQKVNEELLAEQSRDRFELSDSGKDIQIELLQLEAQLKTTAKERRDVELRILDAMKEQEKARLEAVIADKEASKMAKAQAAQRLASLDSIYAGRAAGVVEGTKSPLEDYMSRLPDTTEKWNEALENVAVNGLQAVEDGLVSILTGTKSVGEALHDMLGQIIQDLIRLGIQRAISMAISSGGLGFATGGYVSGPGTATSDSIPAMLSNGEYVVNSKAVGSFGVPFFNAINTGQITPQMLGAGVAAGGGGKGLGKGAAMGAFGILGGMFAGGNFGSIFGLAGGLLGFSRGGLVGGVPIPRASMGARANVSNDNRAMRGGDTHHWHFPNVTNAREARTAGIQAAGAFKSRVGQAMKVYD